MTSDETIGRPTKAGSVAIGLGVACLALTGCSGGDDDAVGRDPIDAASTATSDAGSESAPDATSTPTALPPIGEPADDATRAELVAALGTVFDAVRSGPVMIEFELTESGRRSAASIRVDQGRGLVDATWVQTTRRGSEITTRNVVVGGRSYFKSTASAEAAAAFSFVEIDEQSGIELLDNVFTAYGQIGPSLDRYLVLIESLPFRIDVAVDRSIERTTVQFDPREVVALYAERGLERVGGGVPEEPMTLTFIVDAGRLVGLTATGTQFHDGEALELDVELAYAAVEQFELEPPPVDDG